MTKTTILCALVSLFAIASLTGCDGNKCGNGVRDGNEVCDFRQDFNCNQVCTGFNTVPGGAGQCYANNPTLPGCIPSTFQQCVPCTTGGIGGQFGQCYANNPTLPGCVPSQFQQCIPCTGGIGGQFGQCYATAPTAQGCVPGQPAQCVPCSFGGGLGQQCFATSPTTPGCVPGVPAQCIPCSGFGGIGGIGGINQCCRNPQNPFGPSQLCSQLCPGQIPGQSPLCQLDPTNQCLGGAGGFGQRCYPQAPTTPGCIDNPAAGIICVQCTGIAGGIGGFGTCRADGIVGPGELCDPLLTPQCNPITCTFGFGGTPGLPGIPGLPGGVPGIPTFPGGGIGGGINPLPGIPGLGSQIYPIACGDKVQFNTLAGGSAFTVYPTCGGAPQLGPENIYAFTPFFNAEVRVDIDDDNGADVNFFVLADAPDPFRCIEAGRNVDRFPAAAGRTYFIVADSDLPFTGGSYELEIDCDQDNGCDLFAGCGGFGGFGGFGYY